MKAMKLAKGLLLSAVVGTTCASPDLASVYIFQGNEWPSSATPPIITPEEACLIWAHRLGVPEYHAIGNPDWISHINTFGKAQDSQIPQLLLVVEGVSSKKAKPLASTFMPLWSAFKISQPPSLSWTRKLVKDLEEQMGSRTQDCAFADAINPYMTDCWNGKKSKIISLDLANTSPSIEELNEGKDRLIKYAKNSEMDVMVVFMPETSRSAHTYKNPYGLYDMPSQVQFERRDVAEEPMMTDAAVGSTAPISHIQQLAPNSTAAPITGVPPVCYSSNDTCTGSTNGCSGHGKCFKKSGIKNDSSAPACWACMCKPTVLELIDGDGKKSNTTTYWGGAACQKEDISTPFWLLFVVSLILVGVVAWGISMLFSIGEEKLPGVIGAGVSSNKAR